MRLIVDKVNCRRGERIVLAEVSFTVSAGEALLLTGPNGSGKTTLLRTIAGLLPPAAGSVRVEGGAREAEPGEYCHYIGHRDGVRPSLTVAETVAFWCRYLGAGEAAASTALDRLEIAPLADIPAMYLSAGQRRRVGLARLLTAQRPIWLLDEPTTSLDAQAQATFAALVKAHRSTGGIVIAATHAPLGVAGAREIRLGTRLAA